MNAQSPSDVFRMNANLSRTLTLTKRLFTALSKRDARSPGAEGPGAPFYLRSMLGFTAGMLTNPFQLMNLHMHAMGSLAAMNSEIYKSLVGGEFTRGAGRGAKLSEMNWRAHPYFIALRHQHDFVCKVLDEAVTHASMGEKRHSEQLRFFSDQVKALLSPDNYLLTNPEAVARLIETRGQSLVNGLQNLVDDIERANGDMVVALTDPKGFKVGEDLAVTPGHVVHETPLYQLIRYAPQTETAYRTPLLFIPAWINKFYILDLQEKNSMLRWMVRQGFPVYVVSWRNPGPDMRDYSFDDYVLKGVVDAVENTCRLSKRKSVNIAGYCIGGTAVSTAAAWLAAKDEPSPIKSITLFTSVTDFTDIGDVSAFLDENFTKAIVDTARKKGVVDKWIMAKTFSYLRPSDLVYDPAVQAYLLGEPRPKFDLLFWNGDPTNLPEKMAREYLHKLCRDNLLAKGKLTVGGVRVNLGDVKQPFYAIAGETDHIAPWKTCFNGMNRFGGKGRLVLARSGHIAGVVNPPEKRKYGYFVSDEGFSNADDWLKGAELHEGSWWPDWAVWLGKRSGRKFAVKEAWPSDHPQLEAAPGRYVLA